MTSYRNVDAELRINTLEARLAERDASLAARDAELNEYRALDRSFRALRIYRAVAACGVLTTAAGGVAFAAERAAHVRDQGFLHDSIDLARGHQQRTATEIAAGKLALNECTQTLVECNRDLRAAHRAPSVALYGAFDRARIDHTLDAAGVEASKCGKALQLSGTGSVSMVFDPLEGAVTSASLDPGPLSGTPAEACIVAPFLRARLDEGAFKGAIATVTRDVTLR